jgi:dolichol-phosphate mannosyltransferase
VRVSVVVPCYNEAAVLPALRERLERAAGGWGCEYEVVMVDDGSVDGTWEGMAAIHAADARWKAVGLARNFGHQVALWTGLGAVSGDVVVVIDADLQDPPEVVGEFLRKWEEGYDVVYGVRRKRKEGLLKRGAYFWFYRLLAALSDVDVPLDSGDFCLMDRRVADVVASVRDRRPFVRGLRAWAGFRQVALEYERDARAAGEAKYTVRKLTKLAIDGILSSSIQPLRVASYMGMVISVLAFVGAVFTVVQRVFARQFEEWGFQLVPGFATIVVAVLFLGGVQLLCVGVLGEYVGRIYESVKGMPPSVVARRLGGGRE